MPGVEGGPTPEEMGIPTNEVSPGDQYIDQPAQEAENQIEDVQEVAEATPESLDGEQTPTPDEKPGWGEISPEKQEGIDEVYREVAAGFGMAYEVLPHAGKLDEDRILKVLDQIKTVQTMGPAVKIKVADVIVRDKLHTGNKEDFVFKLLNLEYVVVWIMSQGSQRADDNRIEELRQQIKDIGAP